MAPTSVSQRLTFSVLLLLATPSFAESTSKVIGMSNDMESWMSANGGANDCLSLAEDLSLYGGFYNSCPFEVQYLFCAYRPEEDAWTAAFDCEKNKFGYDIIKPKSRQSAHTKNAEAMHWVACPYSDMEGKFLDIHLDAKWDGQRKQIAASCTLKSVNKEEDPPGSSENAAGVLTRRGNKSAAQDFNQAMERAESEEAGRPMREAQEREREQHEEAERERVAREREARQQAAREQAAREEAARERNRSDSDSTGALLEFVGAAAQAYVEIKTARDSANRTDNSDINNEQNVCTPGKNYDAHSCACFCKPASAGCNDRRSYVHGPYPSSKSLCN